MIKLNKLSTNLGAEITGVDLSKTITTKEFGFIYKAFLKYHVIVIRNQTLEPLDQIKFSKRFGKLDIHIKNEFLHPSNPEILILSNKKNKDGSNIGFEDAGRYWHTDMSYKKYPSKASMLYAIEIPESGGDTFFCNMHWALENLDSKIYEIVKNKHAIHSYVASFEGQTSAKRNISKLTNKQKTQLTEVSHPIIRKHPETGNLALYVNPGFTTLIKDFSQQRSKEILNKIFETSTKKENIFKFKWQKNDFLIWDNRSVMHHATKYDSKQTRHMHRTTIIGDQPKG